MTTWDIKSSKASFDAQKALGAMHAEHAAYVVEGFMEADDCKQAVSRFRKSPNIGIDPVDPPIAKLGISLYEFSDIGEYFSKAGHFQSYADDIFTGLQNPIDEIARKINDAGQAFRPLMHEGKKAFYGVIRDWYGRKDGLAALPHEDFIEPNSDPRFSLLETSQTLSQASFVICLSNGKSGGTTRIYSKRPTAEEFSNPKNRYGYGFSDEFIRDSPYADVHLNPGDVMVFPSSHLHYVQSVPTDGPPRITRQMFAGRLADGDIIYWS